MTDKIRPRLGFWSWRFRFQFDQLQDAYRASRQGVDRERKTLEAAYLEFKAKVEAGEASWTEEDDDGHVVYDHGEHFGERLDAIDSVLAILRESFTISLHHLWEKHIKELTKTSYVQEKALAYLKEMDLPADEKTIDTIRLVANVMKHSGGKSATELHEKRPDLFDAAEMAKWNDLPGQPYLRISDATVEEFFAAVRTFAHSRPRV